MGLHIPISTMPEVNPHILKKHCSGYTHFRGREFVCLFCACHCDQCNPRDSRRTIVELSGLEELSQMGAMRVSKIFTLGHLNYSIDDRCWTFNIGGVVSPCFDVLYFTSDWTWKSYLVSDIVTDAGTMALCLTRISGNVFTASNQLGPVTSKDRAACILWVESSKRWALESKEPQSEVERRTMWCKNCPI